LNADKLTDTGTKHPWVVQVALTTLNQKNLKIVVKIGQSESSAICSIVSKEGMDFN
jgi:hypothetical protein